MRFYGYGMQAHWMGGTPAEGLGPVPPQLSVSPSYRQTTAPDVFANQIMDLEMALRAGGQSLVAKSRGNRVEYYAGGRMVAEAMQVPGGFIGSIHAVPDRAAMMKTAKGEFMAQQRFLGYRGYGNPDSSSNGGGTARWVVGTVVGVGVLAGLIYVGWRLGRAR